jgi:type II secretory pathway pseudopilin PulG
MNSETITLYFFSAVISILITALIFNFVFSVTAFKKHTKAQTNLLCEIAKQKGVAEEKIKAITDTLE